MLDVQAPGGLRWVVPDEAVQPEAPCKPDVAQSAALSPGAKELQKPLAVSPVSLCLPVR